MSPGRTASQARGTARVRFAGTFPGDYEPNPLTRLLAARRAAGAPLIDLTESNPAVHGLSPDPMRLAPGITSGLGCYRPEPRGAPGAREAVAVYYRERGISTVAERVVLTASTSEAYGWLLKLLCEPGDGVLVPTPGYPLCADLARLERVRSAPYRLRPAAEGWCLDRACVAAGLRRGARAVIAISPHNPTGAYLSSEELRWLGAACADHGAALIVDEVFADYPWDAAARDCFRGDAPALTFLLGGLSKALALPQLKCSWIVVAGPRRRAEEAAAHLDFLGDTYLSVNGMVQEALPQLLARRHEVQEPIRSRVRANVAALCAAVLPACPTSVTHGGGWWWLQPLPAAVDDAEFALALLRDRGTLVHPGYLFDAEEPGVALSLITAPETFAAGIACLVAALEHDHPGDTA